jgi:branched-chain amino acid transport system substrate-binding protein
MKRTNPRLGRRGLVGGALAAPCIFAGRASAQGAGEPLRIAVLNDQTGPYADLAGPGSVHAARMAVADFGASVLGRPIEVLVGDHQNKPDVGLSLVREWFGPGRVSMVMDFANSAVSLGAQPLARQFDKIAVHVSSTSSDITGKGCSPNSFQWAQTTYADAAALFQPLLRAGKKTYFFVTVDYVFGLSTEADATRAITAGGGRVVGSVKHPLNTADFGSYLMSATTSRAEVVVIASSGSDMANAVKQAAEFGLTRRQSVVTPICYLTDVHALGLQAAQGLQFVQSWYWDLDEASRDWAKRFSGRTGRMPTDLQAAAYSAALHYLRGVKAAGSADTQPVLAAMRSTPVQDMYTRNGRIQANGKMVFDLYLMRVKSPDQSKAAWDYFETVARVPAAESFPSAEASGCPLKA